VLRGRCVGSIAPGVQPMIGAAITRVLLVICPGPQQQALRYARSPPSRLLHVVTQWQNARYDAYTAGVFQVGRFRDALTFSGTRAGSEA